MDIPKLLLGKWEVKSILNINFIASTLALLSISIFTSSSVHALSSDYDNLPITTIFDQLEASDIVLDATVANITSQEAIGGLPESYRILHLDASVVDSTGLRPVDGRIQLRIPPKAEGDNYFQVGKRFIGFINGNGERYWPFTNRSGRGFSTAVFSVTKSGTVTGSSNGKPLLKIDRDGQPYYGQRFNKCGLNDAPLDLSGSDLDENGNIIREYTRIELLELTTSFTCPDGGSQWVRGGDAPKDYVIPESMSVDDFLNKLVKHKASLNLRDATIDGYLDPPNSQPLIIENNVEKSSGADEILLRVLKETPQGGMQHLSIEFLEKLYARETIRGRRDDFPPEAIKRILTGDAK